MARYEISFKFPIGVPTRYKILFSGSLLCDNVSLLFILLVKLPFDIDIHHLIDDLRIFSWEAADTLIYYSEIIKKNNIEMVDIKAGNEPVTVADLTVNNSIVKKLKEKYSKYGWNIITEESGEIGISNLKKQSDFTWVLDPLDGTKDFIQGTGNYAMHLALNYKGRPFLGVVLIPEKNELWISDGTCCWCEGRDS